MSNTNTIDWSKAPKDATHFSPDGRWCKWYKQVNGVWYYYDNLKWNLSSNIKDIRDRYIPRYTVQPETEWKIRHIKPDDYKSGRDVAITILYKEIGNGYYEYKFAICSRKDMFSRKKGVAEALKKESDKLYNEGSVPFTGLILMHMSISNKFSKDTRSLILSKMVELV